jgi:hypothetical protein
VAPAAERTRQERIKAGLEKDYRGRPKRESTGQLPQEQGNSEGSSGPYSPLGKCIRCKHPATIAPYCMQCRGELGISLLATDVTEGKTWQCSNCKFIVDKWYTEFRPDCENCHKSSYMVKIDVTYQCSSCDYQSKERWCVDCGTSFSMVVVDIPKKGKFKCLECKTLSDEYYCPKCESSIEVWPLSEKEIAEEGSLTESLIEGSEYPQKWCGKCEYMSRYIPVSDTPECPICKTIDWQDVKPDIKTWAITRNTYPHKGPLSQRVGFTKDLEREKRQEAKDKGNEIVGPL